MRFFIKLFNGNMGQDVGPTKLIDTDSIPDDKLNYEFNRAYFCMGCGRTWCTWELDQLDFVGFTWRSFHRTCPDHQQGMWQGDLPGSMLLYPTDLIILPRSILELELNNYMERT